jgi:hypothetical protein
VSDLESFGRAIPIPFAESMTATIIELRRPGYEAARELLNMAT